MALKKNHIPEIRIAYNRFLDPIFIFYCQNNPELKQRGWNDWTPPSRDEVKERVERYKAAWERDGEKILQAIQNALGLTFVRNVIDVHVVSGLSRGFSSPIVLKSGFAPGEFVDVLAHELIHVLFQDNVAQVPTSMLDELFPGESITTRNHILVHAALAHLYLDILKDEKRLEANRQRSGKTSDPGYVRAWEIVDERGYQNLLNLFKDKVPLPT